MVANGFRAAQGDADETNAQGQHPVDDQVLYVVDQNPNAGHIAHANQNMPVGHIIED